MKNECKTCSIKSKAASKLSDDEIEKLSFNCALVKFHKGDQLIKQGSFLLMLRIYGVVWQKFTLKDHIMSKLFVL